LYYYSTGNRHEVRIISGAGMFIIQGGWGGQNISFVLLQNYQAFVLTKNVKMYNGCRVLHIFWSMDIKRGLPGDF